MTRQDLQLGVGLPVQTPAIASSRVSGGDYELL